MRNLVRIVMGSEKDFEFCAKIGEFLKKFNAPYEFRVASAHKTPETVLEIIREDESDLNMVYITVAGRSNALSGFVDANTYRPVITCPPYNEKFAGVDIFSSLRMPSGLAPLVCLEPESAALAAVKILGMRDRELVKRVEQYQKELKEKIYKADERVRSGQI